MIKHSTNSSKKGARENALQENSPGFLNFLITSLVSMANDPANTKYFFPVFLSNLKVNGKTIVPYETDMNLGQVTSLEKQASKFVCQDGWAGYNHYGAAEATAPPVFNITRATINGLNNATITEFVIDPPTQDLQYPMIFTANFNAYNNYDPLGISPGEFSFDVNCQTTDGKHSEDLPATGTFTATFNVPVFTLVLLMSFNDDLTATVAIPAQYTPAGTQNPIPGLELSFGESGGLSISDITVNAGSNIRAAIENLTKTAFSQHNTLDKIITVFNENINQSSTTGDIAAAISEQMNGLINNLK